MKFKTNLVGRLYFFIALSQSAAFLSTVTKTTRMHYLISLAVIWQSLLRLGRNSVYNLWLNINVFFLIGRLLVTEFMLDCNYYNCCCLWSIVYYLFKKNIFAIFFLEIWIRTDVMLCSCNPKTEAIIKKWSKETEIKLFH